MKSLKTAAVAAFLVIGSLAFGQPAPPLNEPDTAKPKIFADLPERMAPRMAALTALLLLPEGASVSTQIAEGFGINGTVVSTFSAPDGSSQSIVLKTTNRSGAILTFSRLTKSDGTVRYTGRVVAPHAGDALTIALENDEYTVRKTALHHLMNE